MKILQVFQCYPSANNPAHCHFHKVFYNALKENCESSTINDAVVFLNIFKRKNIDPSINKIYYTGFSSFDQILLSLQFKLLCKIKKYDIICFHFLITYLKLGSPSFSSKSILIEHINYFNEYELNHNYSRRQILNALSNFNKIFAVSDGTKAEIINYVNGDFNVNCSTLPNIILINNYLKPHFISKKKEYNLFIVGHVSKRKNQLFLLRAINYYRTHYSNVVDFKIFIIGDIIDSEYFNKLNHYSKENKISLKFMPSMKNLDLLKFNMSSCDIGINCSSSESFGIVTAEFLSLGIPVLVSNTNGSKYIVNRSDLGCIFEYNSQQDFCLKLSYLVNEFQTNPKLIKQTIEDRFAPRVVISKFLFEMSRM